jgi:ribosome-associated toxin RatA of RatAB toxin-antitoxin module
MRDYAIFSLSGSLSIFVLGIVALVLTGCATPPSFPERLEFLNYQGQVNAHYTLIQAPPSRVFHVLTDFDRFITLIPSDRVQLRKITPGPYQVGTAIRAETIYKIRLTWDSQVVQINKDRLLVLQFQNGPFQGGYEVWELKAKGSCTRVSHTLVYNISNFFYRLVWLLKQGEKRHNNLTEVTLLNLKRECEEGLLPPFMGGPREEDSCDLLSSLPRK